MSAQPPAPDSATSSATFPTLFSPFQLAEHSLAHRVVMAPLTRMRASLPGNHANAMNAEYYGQRASQGGLIIGEAAQITQDGQGAPCTPGLYTDEQIAGWRLSVDAVHAQGGVMFAQLWHMGRLSHPSYQPGGALPVAPSAVAAHGQVTTASGERVPYPVPRALSGAEIETLIGRYAQAGRNALAAGFDGIEIHSANGYLLEQFLQSRTNQRSDQWGGSIGNRCRMVIEVTRAICEAIGPERVGIRLSPWGVANDSGEADPMPLYGHLVDELNAFGLAYLHLIEPRASGAGQREVDHQNVPSAAREFRPLWQGPLIAAGNFLGASAEAMLAAGDADLIAFGRYFIANPDLPERLRQDAPLNAYHRPTFYSRGPEGYLDYPRLGAA